MDKIKQRFILLLKAMGMGAADVIPGVSGGTIAFITGIYQRFIDALSNIDLLALKLFLTGKWMQLERKIHGFFLLTLLTGVLISVLTLAGLIQFLLAEYPLFIWAFFFGLIGASIVIVAKGIEKWNFLLLFWLIAGGVIAYFLTHSSIVHTPNTPLYIFFAGIISISAMILPGISGSYLLVVLDKYEFIIGIMSSITGVVKTGVPAMINGNFSLFLSEITDNNIHMLLYFYAGTFLGLVGFSKVLSWLFKKYYLATIALLTGFMAGSLIKIWPWKVTIETYIDRHGVEKPLLESNILPQFNQAETYLVILIMIIGFYIVWQIEYLSKIIKKDQN